MSKAVLIGIDFRSEKITHQFHEGDNPGSALALLQASIEEDFPNSVFIIYRDERAAKEWAEYIVPRMLGEVSDDE